MNGWWATTQPVEGLRFTRRVAHRALTWLGVGWVLAGVLLSSGCSLDFWRRQADAESYHILAKKADYPLWEVPRLSVQPDPRSRFFDPYRPDHEPLPPDDPAAHKYMLWVDGMKGGWHKIGTALSIENPQWLEPYGLTPEMLYPDPPCEGVATVSHVTPQPLPTIAEMGLDEAVELANIHNRQYQTQIEQVYLSALELSFEQFRFDVRFLGFGGEPSADLTYANTPGGADALSLNSRFGISRLLPTGGQWVLELANNTIWIFSGDNQTSTASVLSYSIVQPLFRNGGRKFALENLTQAERNVLYAVRLLARFRKEFFTDIVVNGPGGGFLGLLQQRQQIRNQIDNIEALELQVERLRALASQKPEIISEPLAELPIEIQVPAALADQLSYDPQRQLLAWQGPMTAAQAQLLAGLSDDPDFQIVATEIIQRVQTEVVTLDVAQLESQLASSRQRQLSLEAVFADTLDNYKIFLGLPPDMPVTLDEELLKQFELIDPRLSEAEDEVRDFVGVWGELDSDQPDAALLREVAAQFARLVARLDTTGLELVRGDFQRVEDNLEARLERLTDEEQRAQVRENLQRDRRLFRDSATRYETLALQAQQLQRAAAGRLTADQARELIREIAILREDLLRLTQSLSVVQVGLRAELIRLEPFEMTLEEVTALALQNRLDLMNQRAVVSDARRKIAIAANQLEGMVDVVVEGDVRTPTGNRPFDFRGARSDFRTGLRLTAPLDQILERNNYRAAQIEYQQARRDYMEFEDQVKFQVRQEWRQLQVLRANFEIARQAVRFAALQLDQAAEETAAPVQPGQQQFGGRDGLNLLQALSSILSAQDNLIQIWVNYERNRLNVYRDMGIMEIDAQGLWTDPLYMRLAPRADTADDSLPPPSAADPALDGPRGPQPEPRFPGDGDLPPLDDEPELIPPPAADDRLGAVARRRPGLVFAPPGVAAATDAADRVGD